MGITGVGVLGGVLGECGSNRGVWGNTRGLLEQQEVYNNRGWEY